MCCSRKLTLGILASGRGTSLEKVILAIEQGILPAQIALIISNKVNAPVLEYQQKYGIKTLCIPQENNSREQHEQLINTAFHEHHVDLILLIGYLRILSPVFVQQWPRKILNVHPSLLPAFAGLMDLEVHRAVLQASKQESGCTVHYVDNTVDGGEILLHKRCLVVKEDTSETLKIKVQALEGETLIESVLKVIQFSGKKQ